MGILKKSLCYVFIEQLLGLFALLGEVILYEEKNCTFYTWT